MVTALNELAQVAASIFEVPVATVSVLGPERPGAARETATSFAAVVAAGHTVVAADLPGDLGFFAGVPVLHPDGRVLATLCLADRRPHEFGERQRSVLAGLAGQAARHLVAQGERDELSRMREREEDFVATVTHELRTPVTVMRGYLEALADEDDLAPYHCMIDPIRRNGDRLVRMVDHLLAGARAEQVPPITRPGTVDLAAVAHTAVAALLAESRSRGVRIRLVTAGRALPVTGDFGRLCQMAEHLLRNAVSFSERGGEVTLRVATDESGPLLEIVDHGAGVPADELPYLTERFYRGRHAREHAVPGIGLGLTIALSIATAHNGTLALASPGVGRGTTAQVRIPLIRQGAGPDRGAIRKIVHRPRPTARTRKARR